MEQIKIDLSLDKTALLPDTRQTAYMMVKLTAPENLVDDRPDQNLSFVIDRSGSMSGTKLDYTKTAVSFAIGHLGPQDYCSVVAFDDMVNMIASSHKVENKDALKMAVESIYSGGTTNLSGGMLMGMREVKLAYRENQINRVLLLTDGMANVGVTDHRALVEKAAEMAGAGINLSTFGLGEDFEEDLLQAMSEVGGGNFYYIESPDQIPGIFEEELSGLLSIIAQNLTIKVKPGRGIGVNGVLGYPFDPGNDVKVSLPDIYSGETKILLFELDIPPCQEGVQSHIELELEYADVRNNLALVNLSAGLEVHFNADNEGPVENMEVVKQLELFRCMQAKEEAIRLADEGDFEAGHQVLKNRVLDMRTSTGLMEDSDMLQELDELNDSICFMQAENYTKSSRKKMAYSAYRQKRGRGKRK